MWWFSNWTSKIIGTELKIHSSFNYSIGWFRRFKERSQIHLYTLHGDSAIFIGDLDSEIEKIKNLLKPYHINDIYNFDETALFYRMKPSKSLATNRTFATKKDK